MAAVDAELPSPFTFPLFICPRELAGSCPAEQADSRQSGYGNFDCCLGEAASCPEGARPGPPLATVCRPRRAGFCPEFSFPLTSTQSELSQPASPLMTLEESEGQAMVCPLATLQWKTGSTPVNGEVPQQQQQQKAESSEREHTGSVPQNEAPRSARQSSKPMSLQEALMHRQQRRDRRRLERMIRRGILTNSPGSGGSSSSGSLARDDGLLGSLVGSRGGLCWSNGALESFSRSNSLGAERSAPEGASLDPCLRTAGCEGEERAYLELSLQSGHEKRTHLPAAGLCERSLKADEPRVYLSSPNQLTACEQLSFRKFASFPPSRLHRSCLGPLDVSRSGCASRIGLDEGKEAKMAQFVEPKSALQRLPSFSEWVDLASKA